MCDFTRAHKCKKTHVKKSKVTSQISTCASNKKDNEKYYQHYVDDDSKNTTIDLVNDDCMAEIFTYLPVCERPKIALVCKKWKDALDYSWQNVEKLELTHWEYDECPSYFYYYPTINGHLKFLRSLLHKCGRYLTELDLTAYGHCNIVAVINKSCPNLVKLRLRFKYIEQKVLVDAFSRLSKLKVLKIIIQHIHNSEYIPVNLINSLRSIAGTLTELTLSYWDEENLYESLKIPKTFVRILPELKTLKSIETAGILIDTDLYMHLDHFGILVISHDDLCLVDNINETFLYEDVIQLVLDDYEITDDCLYTIANCMKLETLVARCERVTDAGIVAISKMTNLVFLDLCGPNLHVTDSSIKLLKNFSFLRLPYSNKITDVSVTKILENSPKIEKFCIADSSTTLEFLKKAKEFATNRKLLLELGFSYSPGLQQYESRYFHLILLDSSRNAVYWSINFKGK